MLFTADPGHKEEEKRGKIFIFMCVYVFIVHIFRNVSNHNVCGNDKSEI